MGLHEYIIGYQLLKQENRAHRGLDAAGYFLKGLRPLTDEPFRIPVDTPEFATTGEVREATVDEVKQYAEGSANYITVKIARIDNYKMLLGSTLVEDALGVFHYTASAHAAQLGNHVALAGYITSQVGIVAAKNELAVAGDYVHANISPVLEIPLSEIAFHILGRCVIVSQLIDDASYMFHGMKPSTGQDLPVHITFDQIKNGGIVHCENTLVYYARFLSDIGSYGRQFCIDELLALGVDLVDMETLLDEITTVAGYVQTEAAEATKVADLITLADYIDANIPKLPLYRRAWALEI